MADFQALQARSLASICTLASPPRLGSKLRLLAPFALAGVLGGTPACDSASSGAVLPTPDREQFTADVYPVLLRDCSFHACHGDSMRPFQVYGAGRRRLADAEGELPFPLDPSLPQEIDASYDRARSMLLYRGEDVAMAPLLRKIRPGGAHEGVDARGLNVYLSTDAFGYRVLEAWARGEATPEPDDDDDETETDGDETEDEGDDARAISLAGANDSNAPRGNLP